MFPKIGIVAKLKYQSCIKNIHYCNRLVESEELSRQISTVKPLIINVNIHLLHSQCLLLLAPKFDLLNSRAFHSLRHR